MENLKKYKNDLVLLGAIAVLGLILFCWIYVFGDNGSTAAVIIDGKVVATYPLNQDGTFELNDGSNTLTIEDGHAYMSDATCPDQLCVHMGKKSQNGETIVCLPNEVIVEIRTENANDGFDAVTQ